MVYPWWHLQWIKSYFSCRQQFVQFNLACFSMQTIKCGIPQGSILGPLCFPLYINDLPNAYKLTQPLLFADETSISYSPFDLTELQSTLNNKLCKYDMWLKRNNLSLFFGNYSLEQTNVNRFLLIYVDEHLQWKHHISYKSVGIIFRARFYISEN